MTGEDAEIIFTLDHGPLSGALGLDGARAAIGLGDGPGTVQSITKVCGDKVYRGGGGAISPKDHKTAIGVTVVGALEKCPVATNEICWPLTV